MGDGLARFKRFVAGQMRYSLAQSGPIRYNARFILLLAELVETNALNAKIKDLGERTDVLRGYL